MSRRKSEITGHINERDFPHIVELELPLGDWQPQQSEVRETSRTGANHPSIHLLPERRGTATFLRANVQRKASPRPGRTWH